MKIDLEVGRGSSSCKEPQRRVPWRHVERVHPDATLVADQAHATRVGAAVSDPVRLVETEIIERSVAPRGCAMHALQAEPGRAASSAAVRLAARVDRPRGRGYVGSPTSGQVTRYTTKSVVIAENYNARSESSKVTPTICFSLILLYARAACRRARQPSTR